MRLIHTTSLELKEFFGSQLPPYAILSHTWSKDEVSYQEYLQLVPNHTFDPRLKKILDCCALARKARLEWVWIDTCCIDKASSAELSEAINSMFTWYERSTVCLAFLSDVSEDSDVVEFSRSRWFKRGWTLQELIAPRVVRFFDAHAVEIGTKESLADGIAAITKIPVDYLNRTRRVQYASVAQRMSWAAARETTRVEDIAYCLLGLFDVNMPLLYGEGSKAFQRLLAAIISQSDDETVFVWLSDRDGDERGMLAESPSEFAHTGHIRPIHFERKREPAALTSRGLEIRHAPTHPLAFTFDIICEILLGRSLLPASMTISLRLDCELTDQQGRDHWVGIVLRRNEGTGVWYRQDASRLFCMRQNAYFRKTYPAPGPTKRIYVDAPKDDFIFPYSRRDHSLIETDAYVKYTRSAPISLLWQMADTVSGASHIWLVCALHQIFGLRAPSSILSWAYLTGDWILQGQPSSYVLTVLILGLCGFNFDQHTYDSFNIFMALFGLVPIVSLQLFFDMGSWTEMRTSPRTSWHRSSRRCFGPA